MLLCGTHEGVYRVDELPATDPDRVLDCDRVWELRAGPETYHAAASDGLYRSTDAESWSTVGLDREPTAVLPTEGAVVVGTSPLGVVRQGADADRWLDVGDLAVHPHSQRWRDRAQGDHATVRALAVHPEAGILAGLEPGGVLAFDGDVWRQFGRGVHDDVHDLLVLEDGAVVAATGNGLYRTADGDCWYRLDTDFRDFWSNYFRETVDYGGRLYTSANSWGPERPGGAILHGPIDGGTLDRQPLPTGDPAFVVSWAVHDGDLVAGTMGVDEDGFLQATQAALLRLTDDGWETAGTLPAAITSLAAGRA